MNKWKCKQCVSKKKGIYSDVCDNCYNKKWRKEHPEKVKLYSKKHHLNNPEYYQKSIKEWQQNNIKKIKKYHEEYRQNNSLKVNMWNIKRRMILLNIKHNFTHEEWVIKVGLTKGICLKCKKLVGYKNLTMDHIVSLSSGRKRIYTIQDIQPLCKSCNSSKGSKLIRSKKQND